MWKRQFSHTRFVPGTAVLSPHLSEGDPEGRSAAPWPWRWAEASPEPRSTLCWLDCRGWNPADSKAVSLPADTGTAWDTLHLQLPSCQINNAPGKGNRSLACGMSGCKRNWESSCCCLIWVMPLRWFLLFKIPNCYFCLWHFLSSHHHPILRPALPGCGNSRLPETATLPKHIKQQNCEISA